MSSLDKSLLELRLIVGYLGEKDQFGWWNSSFFSRVSDGFLRPVFPKTAHLAKLTGVVGAAARLHEERIGRGRVFHIFRLPEELEFRQHEVMRTDKLARFVDKSLGSSDAAMGRLAELAATKEVREGPICLGDETVLPTFEWVSQAASIYHTAFSERNQAFPYWNRIAESELTS